MIPRLDDPEAYREVLDSIAKKWFARGRLERLEVDGLTMAELRGRTDPLAKLLAKTVAAGKYRYSALVPVSAFIGGKRRTLYRPNLLDRVVLTLSARYLAVLSEPFLLPVLHSYRKGRSPWKAIGTLRSYLQAHAAAVPLLERGVFLLRRDVKKYGENIDTGPSSQLWSLLARVTAADPDAQRRAVSERLIRDAIRQPVLQPDGTLQPLPCGIPTGSPIQPPCANLYLSALDELCSNVAGGFYSRFGDDILFCHPDAQVALDVSRNIDSQLALLGLTSKQEKRRDLDFNGAGRRRRATPEFSACNRLEYLGASIDFQGRIGLKLDKARDFERVMRLRLGRVAGALREAERDERIDALCATLRVAIEPADPMAVSQAEFLRHLATTRAQLRDLDFRLALMVAELVSGKRGPRAFREVPYRELRCRGLPSLVTLRDRKAAARGGVR